MTEKLPEDVKLALQQGDMLDAIKRLRAKRAMGLKEAKDFLEAWQRTGGAVAFPESQPLAAASTLPDDLPEDVVAALCEGNKLEAIRRLRHRRPMGLKDAKDLVESWSDVKAARSRRGPAYVPGVTRVESGRPRWIGPVALLLTFVWALVNSVGAASAVIVLLNADGYRPDTFIVESLIYRPDDEGGLIWGLAGSLSDGPARYLNPAMADGKKEGAAGLSRRFPPGTQIQVSVNRSVTDTLFQGRSLQVLPGDVDLRGVEASHLKWWLLNCLLPFVLAMIYARWDERRHA